MVNISKILHAHELNKSKNRHSSRIVQYTIISSFICTLNDFTWRCRHSPNIISLSHAFTNTTFYEGAYRLESRRDYYDIELERRLMAVISGRVHRITKAAIRAVCLDNETVLIRMTE